MKRAFSTLTVATLALLGALPLPGTRRASAQPADADYFYAQDRKVGVTLVLDQLGVAARDGVDRRRVEAALAQFQLKLVQEHPQGIFFFRLPRALPRPELVRLARRVREEAREIVAYVGFPATPEGAKVPLIVTDELIAKAKPEGRERMLALGQELGLEVAAPDRFVKDQFLLRVKPDARLDALEAANRLHESGAAEFAHPNFVRVIDYRQFVPNDTLFGNQWHHQNTGQGAGTVDADVDTTFAWTITQGAAGTVVAVIDNGFDIGHADLTPNLWVNAGEVAGNNLDDEGNGFTDDVNGFDFGGNDGNPSPGATDNHGTAVAGVAAARGNNSLGVAGACPNCGLMVIRQGVTVQADANSFGYAQQMGAAVITNSWGYTIGTPTTTAVVNAINAAATAGRGGLGSIVLFAMNNGNINDCTGATPDISSIANVIAVSASSNQDRKVTESAFGNCMDVLAPTHRGYGGATPFSGTLNITTTDRTGNAGYNNTNPLGACPSTEPAAPPANARDYTLCFGGTSSATPLTAGVAGLVLTARAGLTRLQVQQLLQDTADKMQDSVGAYASASGFSTPGSGTASHGWGRINAFEAVRVAGPAAQGGRAGVDVFIRDNRLDWGNTEQPSNTLFEPTRGFIPHWQSVDIKVDAPPYQPAPTTNAAFEAFTHENPESGDLNKVYVRVRNRGTVTAMSVGVKLHWAFAGAGLPALPNDFWTAFPADSATTTVWHPLGTQTAANLAYSGSSVANTAGDAAQIVAFDFTGPAIDPTQPNPDHFCLFAVLDSSQDRAQPKSRPTVAADFVPDQLTPTDNNVTHRNVSVVDAVRNRSSRARFFVHNPTERVVKSVLRVQAPRGWRFTVEGVPLGQSFTLKAHERRLVTVQISSPREGAVGDVDVVQEIRFGRVLIKGGTTYRFEVPARSNDPQP